MPTYFFIWHDENIAHLAANGVEQDDFAEIVSNPLRTGTSRTSGRPIAFGRTREGEGLACVYEQIDEMTILPVTAFYTEESD